MGHLPREQGTVNTGPGRFRVQDAGWNPQSPWERNSPLDAPCRPATPGFRDPSTWNMAAYWDNPCNQCLELTIMNQVLGIDVSPHMIPEDPPHNLEIQIDDLNGRSGAPSKTERERRAERKVAGSPSRRTNSMSYTAR
ncbi:hypothetical protein OCS_02308 [Ophiocordyceps sinensis CO18]|uniref:Uncharacterized protein n=1 Tax=Ophiocordyceps sinensis (strain Co18 / CGMCC 3.14243) TaxID=911162 RepID=T5AHA0_OPHSC|nr:hypothetical protein OCS_02308 [Ophiocordyceps sinensis CO18]